VFKLLLTHVLAGPSKDINIVSTIRKMLLPEVASSLFPHLIKVMHTVTMTSIPYAMPKINQ
jgi:hypothetical protein